MTAFDGRSGRTLASLAKLRSVVSNRVFELEKKIQSHSSTTVQTLLHFGRTYTGKCPLQNVRSFAHYVLISVAAVCTLSILQTNNRRLTHFSSFKPHDNLKQALRRSVKTTYLNRILKQIDELRLSSQQKRPYEINLQQIEA